MGGSNRKFKAWAGYEWGTAIGNLSGNCESCTKSHKLLNKPTPCEKCPKWALYPGNYGIHPRNTLAVQLYNLASRDVRVGMDGVLIGTLAPVDAKSVIDLYCEHLPTTRSRQQTYELMVILDRVVTEKRSDKERILREREVAKHKKSR